MNTTIKFQRVDYGVDGINNSTNHQYYPIGGLYTKLADMFWMQFGIDSGFVDADEVFKSLKATITDENDRPLDASYVF